MANLIEGLLEEMDRVRELIKVYDSLEGGVGFISSSMMKVSIQRAKEAIASGDVIEELKAYDDLKGFDS